MFHGMIAVLLQLVIALLIVGVVLWGLSQFPIDPTIYQFIRVAIIVVAAVWVILLLASLLGAGPLYPLPLRR